jgi:putative ABC transport system permease protein
MLTLVLRKMLSNTWMVLCLLLGSLLAVALISSIPVYTEGILQRLLTKDLEQFQLTSQQYPGRSVMERSFVMPDAPQEKQPLYRLLEQRIGADLPRQLGIPVVAATEQLTLDFVQAFPAGAGEAERKAINAPYVKVEALRDLPAHISLVAGHAPAAPGADLVVDAVVSEKALRGLGLSLDGVYDVWDSFYAKTMLLKIRVAGVFTYADPRDPWWFRALDDYNTSVLVDYETLRSRFVLTGADNFSAAAWSFALDYHAIRIGDVPALGARLKAAQRLTRDNRIAWDIPLQAILDQYAARAAVLKLTLWFLEIPMLLMLAFFVYMVSQLIVENDSNEIAVLKSRGSSSVQVFVMYLIESVLLSAAALVAGPPLGFLFCGMLGSSNGFLEFVQRTALPLTLSSRAYLYALLGALLFIVAMLTPAFIASRTTIVEHKRRRGRTRGGPAWKRFYLDAALVALSLYGLYGYHTRQKVISLTGAAGSGLPLDPLLFIISVSFILGAGMVFLRVYPLLVRGLFRLGRRAWSPPLYASFINVGRSMGHEQFLMLFLMLSLGLGVYNSVAARTINRNAEEKVRYSVGADITLQEHWDDSAPTAADDRGGSRPAGAGEAKVVHQWVEPPFEPWSGLAGVQAATKVYRNDGVAADFSAGQRIVSLMGVVPDEFAKVAWFRPDLLPVHQNAYLNLLSSSPKAVLVSSNLAAEYDLKLGDSFTITWADQAPIDVYVYAFVDYWPGYNPREIVNTKPRGLIVGNLSYVQGKMALEPYMVWLQKAPGAGSREIFDDIKAKNLPVESLTDASQEIVARANDPTLQGTNGTLTLGFLIAMGVSIVGFVIYWVLSLKARTLQFGILRAMGMKQRQVLLMLVVEQVLISGAAIVAGILIGSLASALFVPLLQLTATAESQVPPFRIVSQPDDIAKVLAVALAMLVIGSLLFRWMLGRIRIHQAIKLGEE